MLSYELSAAIPESFLCKPLIALEFVAKVDAITSACLTTKRHFKRNFNAFKAKQSTHLTRNMSKSLSLNLSTYLWDSEKTQ
ncbi:hypothetical protein BLOT_005533 [Blomia tropicalis]|nr:hypothetical protein BLOT_005533 [Blomia tropicalis]